MNPLSARSRTSVFDKMCQTPFDILIIGGGITGAGIALDAASRGLKTCLVEMKDFGSGTSGRSTKLIHGGLRYLKQLEFRLVSEIGKEREIVHRNAPHLTKPEHMLLPLYKGGSLGKLSGWMGMNIYEWLAGVKKEEWHKMLSIKETLQAEPLLPSKDLLGSILFYEYRTDDARLTLEVMKEAVRHGASAMNYLKVTSCLYEKEKICGVVVKDQLGNREGRIHATYVVNATGPWVDLTGALDNPKEETKLHITKGIHLVFDQQKLPVKQALYFDTFDKRMIFAIPREGKTYLGTTDTFYDGDITNPTVEKADADYLLRCLHTYFPDLNLKITDIESSWAGLRPLIQKPGKGPSEISRKDEIFESASGLITIAGGKLTGYRKMAQRVVDRIYDKKGGIQPKCITDQIPLPESKFKEWEKNLSPTAGPPPSIKAWLSYSIEEEFCCTLSDFLVRRTSAAYFHIGDVNRWKDILLEYMAELMNWDEPTKSKNMQDLENNLRQFSG